MSATSGFPKPSTDTPKADAPLPKPPVRKAGSPDAIRLASEKIKTASAEAKGRAEAMAREELAQVQARQRSMVSSSPVRPNLSGSRPPVRPTNTVTGQNIDKKF